MMRLGINYSVSTRREYVHELIIWWSVYTENNDILRKSFFDHPTRSTHLPPSPPYPNV